MERGHTLISRHRRVGCSASRNAPRGATPRPWRLCDSSHEELSTLGNMAAPSTSKRRPRERIEISIPLLKRYVRNSAPPRPPISLLPARDSAAFIIDKVVQRRACYIIGWPDLPAARVMISCTRALDYVSPWEMENWEYKDALRREEEEIEKDTAAAMHASAAEMQDAAAQPVLLCCGL